MYVGLSIDKIKEMLAEYVEGGAEGRIPEVVNIAEIFLNEWQEEIKHDRAYYQKICDVLHGTQISDDSEETKENLYYLNQIDKEDIASIAAEYGFIYGLLYAEWKRLKNF